MDTRRQPLERERLAALLEDGLSVREVAVAVQRSPTTVLHWMRAYGLQSKRAHTRHTVLATHADGSVTAICPRHGPSRHVIDRGGHARCRQCRVEAVARRRRRVKEILVAEAGGRCAICGYDRSIAALQFHHVDPAEKAFHLSREGVTRSLARARAEARKCILLCGNCHAEVEAGHQALPLPGPASPTHHNPG